MSDVWIQPTGGALGADVHGVDLSQPVSEAPFARIAEAWGEHLVLRFSGQRIDDRMLMAFSARFGALDRVPIAAANFDRANSALADDVREWVTVISSVVKDGKPVGGLGSYELVWHTDSVVQSAAAARLAALCAGGAPGWRQHRLPQHVHSLRDAARPSSSRAIEGRTCIHDSSRDSAGELRRGFQAHARCPSHAGRGASPRPPASRGASARRCSSAAVPAPTSMACRSRRARRCWTRCGPMPPRSALAWVPEVACRRPGAVGQPQRHAPPRRLRREPAPPDAPHADRRRAGAGRLVISGPRASRPVMLFRTASLRLAHNS